MKKIMIIAAFALAFTLVACAGDRPVTFQQLPAAAQAFITTNYPDDKVSYATVDDDVYRPDYKVVLVSGAMIQFHNDGSLEKIASRNADIPAGLIPVQITEYVKTHFPDASIIEYEVGRRTYEVKLSNRLELKFNRKFNIMEVDD